MRNSIILFNGWLEWTRPSLKEAWSWRTTTSSSLTMACTLSTARHHFTSVARQLRKKMTRASIWATASSGHLPHHRPKQNAICSVESNPCAKADQGSSLSTIPSISVPSFSSIKGTGCRRTSAVLPTSMTKVPKPFSVFLSCRNSETEKVTGQLMWRQVLFYVKTLSLYFSGVVCEKGSPEECEVIHLLSCKCDTVYQSAAKCSTALAVLECNI